MRPAVGARGSFALSGVFVAPLAGSVDRNVGLGLQASFFTSFSSRPGSSPGGRTIFCYDFPAVQSPQGKLYPDLDVMLC